MTISKINMKKIAELEKQNQGNTIFLNTLQHMIDITMTPSDPLDSNMVNKYLATNTLIDLGILDGEKTGGKLNS